MRKWTSILPVKKRITTIPANTSFANLWLTSRKWNMLGKKADILVTDKKKKKKLEEGNGRKSVLDWLTSGFLWHNMNNLSICIKYGRSWTTLALFNFPLAHPSFYWGTIKNLQFPLYGEALYQLFAIIITISRPWKNLPSPNRAKHKTNTKDSWVHHFIYCVAKYIHNIWWTYFLSANSGPPGSFPSHILPLDGDNKCFAVSAKGWDIVWVQMHQIFAIISSVCRT